MRYSLTFIEQGVQRDVSVHELLNELGRTPSKGYGREGRRDHTPARRATGVLRVNRVESIEATRSSSPETR